MRSSRVGGWGTREAQIFAGDFGTPGVAAANGCGVVFGPGRRGVGGCFSLQLRVGSLGAPRPGCAGAPSQFESAGGAERVQQSSLGARIAARCQPPPRRAQLPSCRRQPRCRRLLRGGRRSPRAGCTLRFLQRRLPARLPGSVLSFPFSSSRPFTATSLHPLPPAICKAPLTLALRGARR